MNNEWWIIINTLQAFPPNEAIESRNIIKKPIEFLLGEHTVTVETSVPSVWKTHTVSTNKPTESRQKNKKPNRIAFFCENTPSHSHCASFASSFLQLLALGFPHIKTIIQIVFIIVTFSREIMFFHANEVDLRWKNYFGRGGACSSRITREIMFLHANKVDIRRKNYFGRGGASPPALRAK